MPDASSGNHAVAAWVAGELDLAQQLEFETHLASCPQCQAEVTALREAQRARAKSAAPIKVEVEPPPVAARPPRSAARVLGAAVLILIVGFALGWVIWQLMNR